MTMKKLLLRSPLLVLVLSALALPSVLARVGQTEADHYPIRERNTREATKEITIDELDEFMLTFSFDSPPKELSTFWLGLYMTDGDLPNDPSIKSVEEALANFALPELNARYRFHTVNELNPKVLAQQAIVTSSQHTELKGSVRNLQTLGSELQTQVEVIFRNEPSPTVEEVETTLAAIMNEDMTYFISNLTAIAKGDPELAGVTHAERREEDDIITDPIQAPDTPTQTQNQQRSTKMEILIPVIAAGCLTMAVIALFVVRRKGNNKHIMMMTEQESQVAAQMGGQMVAMTGASACGVGGGPMVQQRVNVFMADNESDDVFSFEAALEESPIMSRLSSATNKSTTTSGGAGSYDESDVFSGVESEMTSPRESRSVFSFLSGFKSEASTVVVSNTTKAKESEDTVALATFKAKISPKASSKSAAPNKDTPTSASGRHSLFTFSEEEEGDLEDEDEDSTEDDDSEMEPLVVESNRSSLVPPPPPHQQQQNLAPTKTGNEEPTKRSGTPINGTEAAVMTTAAMGLTSLLNSSTSEDSVSTEEITAVVGIAGIATKQMDDDVDERLVAAKDSPPPVASKKSGGFTSLFTSKKPEPLQPDDERLADAKDSPPPVASKKSGGFTSLFTSKKPEPLEPVDERFVDAKDSPPPVASKKSGGFTSLFTSKKSEPLQPTPVEEAAVPTQAQAPTAAEVTAVAVVAATAATSLDQQRQQRKKSYKDRSSPGSAKPDTKKSTSSSAWGACSNKAQANIAPSPEPVDTTAPSAWDVLPPQEEEEGDALESESLEDYSIPDSSEDESKDNASAEMTSVPPPVAGQSFASPTSGVQRNVSGSKGEVYLERAKVPRDEDDSVISSATFLALKAQAERNSKALASGYESDPRSSGDERGADQGQQSNRVNLPWDNPLQASSNADQAKAFVARTSPSSKTPSWKRKARENARSVALAEAAESPDLPTPDYSSPGARKKGRRHAKSTTADGSTDYQAETMQQRDESLATFDAVSLSDSEASEADTQDESDTAQIGSAQRSSSDPDHSMFSADSRASSEASASRQLLSDLVWLEKKIAGVASSTASPLSDPKVSSSKQGERPASIEQSDSLSFVSGDETCTSSLHENAKKPPAQMSGAAAAQQPEPLSAMSSIICRDCYAPPGKLRIVIHSTKDGPAVHTVKKDSSLEGHVFPGDLIISVDNVDTRSYTAEQVMKMMTARTKYERKITVLHFDSNNSSHNSSNNDGSI